MSFFAMIGFILAALGAAGWFVAAEQLLSGATKPEPTNRERADPPEASKPAPESATPQTAPLTLVEKPLIARLQEADVMRTLGAILAVGTTVDLTRLGWPTLRTGFPMTTLLNALRDMRAAVTRRAPGKTMPVVAIVGAGETTERSVTALNFALAAARDGTRVLMIDADHHAHKLSNKVNRQGKSEPGRLGWLSIGTRAAREIKTANGISVLPVADDDAGKAPDAIRKALAQARLAGAYDLVILDGPAMPLSSADRKVLDAADALVVVLPTHLDINDSMEDILTALGGAERKLVGVVLNELNPATQTRQRGKQYA
jgi:Mrp family chromosome partitioning ATPase